MYDKNYEDQNINNAVDLGIAAAKGVAWAKVTMWNAIRLVIAGIFGILLLLFLAMGSSHGFDYGTVIWLIICSAVVIRNIKKTIRETRRVKDQTTPKPIEQVTDSDIIDVPFEEIPLKPEPRKMTQNSGSRPRHYTPQQPLLAQKSRKIRVIRDENGTEIRFVAPDEN